MENDRMPFAPATKDAPSVDAAQGPEPEAVPAPDAFPPRPPGSTALTIAAAAFVLLVAVAAWLSVGVPGAAVPTGFTPGVEAALRSRVATEYAAFTVGSAWKSGHDDTVNSNMRLVDVHLAMLSKAHSGFQFTLVYSAYESEAGDASKYRTEEDFFRAGATPAQPTDSFMDMWLHERPGETCFGVMETTYRLRADEARTYYVAATRYEQNGASLTSAQEDYYYAYLPEADSWAATEDPLARFLFDASGALTDTEAVVAQALPGFEFLEADNAPQNNTRLIVRNVRHPDLRVAVYPYQLESPDPFDGLMMLVRGDRVKADAFAEAFSKRYPGSVIWDVTLDPEYASNDDLVEVYFTPSGKTVRFRYDPKRHVWSKVK